MPTPDPLIAKARAFLTELAANNNREWFHANKPRYDADLKAPAKALLDQLSADLEKLGHPRPETKLFRPNRDVRFSKDKTPYQTHLHMLWKAPGCSWFLGIAPDYVSVGGGRMQMDKTRLTRFREAVDADGEPLVADIAALTDAGFRLGAPELKRVPAPYPSDHPHEALLRRKSLTLWHDMDPAPADLHTATQAVFARLAPLQKRLSEI